MSLFKWSTPARRNGERILRIIPTEIYLYILEYVAPPPGRLTPEQIQTFSCLSRVCRFFANICLPRIFEFVEFSGCIFRDDTPAALRKDATYKTSRETMLCAQIAAKLPLALALAKRVKICHFTHWKLDETGSWAVRLFANKYISAMSHMQNIQELKFSNSFVDAEHWNAIAALPSLEELSFVWCRFLQGPSDVEPEKRIKAKVSRLQVLLCHNGFRQPFAAIDAQRLRVLVIDILFFDRIDWHLLPALTELRLRSCYQLYRLTPDKYVALLRMIPMRLPRSLETLELVVEGEGEIVAQDAVQSVFSDPAWKNLVFLRSLLLRVRSLLQDTLQEMLFSISEGIGRLTNLESLTLEDNSTAPQISSPKVGRIVRETLGSLSRIKHVTICKTTLRLVDGKWLEVSSSAT